VWWGRGSALGAEGLGWWGCAFDLEEEVVASWEHESDLAGVVPVW